MGLTSVGEVRRLGGLDDSEAFHLFRLSDEAALEAMIEDEITLAAAYLTSKAGTDYTQTSDTDKQAVFRRAEAYWVLMQLTEPLKARKVMGSQWALDSEDSLSYERLIDTEWQTKFEMLVGIYVPDDTPSSPFSLGAFAVTTPIDRVNDVDCITDQNQRILDEVTCGGSWWTR